MAAESTQRRFGRNESWRMKTMGKKLDCFLLPIFFFLLLADSGRSRTITVESSFGLVEDGVDHNLEPGYLFLNRLTSSEACSPTYGFLPCTTTVVGNIFLILVYGYFMFVGAKLLSEGSEILLQILGPGLVGGFFLPVLSSVPDATIILASGLSGSKETAQSQVSVGMGLLAGSNVLLLTLLWGACLIVGKCDLENSVAVDKKNTMAFGLTRSGLSTDVWTRYGARIMLISLIPYLIVQLTSVLQGSSESRVVILISFIVSISFFVAYCVYQVCQPWIQTRKLAYVRHKGLMSGILKYLKMRTLGNLLTDDGEPDREAIERLFMTLDLDRNGFLSAIEIRALIVGIELEDAHSNIENAIENLINDFDMSRDSRIDMDEFVAGITKWINRAKRSSIMNRSRTLSFLTNFDEKVKRERNRLGNGESGEVEEDEPEKKRWNGVKAGMMLLAGTAIAAAFADPIVDSVDNFSTATSIPSFFVSFVILPFVSSSEVISTMIFSSQKKRSTASLAYSEIYGSVTLGNVLSLAVFLGLVYFRDLTWSFSSEVLVVLIVCLVMGGIAGSLTTFRLWMCSIAFALYPLSLLLVYILDYILGWS